ncbi:MAG TPA: DUF305 domain-containing protein [Gemmatimonadetes bacterium]|nr:DUF305 domain-containing protein [Gemmatimonadota bacterium]
MLILCRNNWLERSFQTMNKAILLTPFLTLACLSNNFTDEEPRILQAGAPGEASRSLDLQELTSIVQPTYNQADVDFMQGMIHHHNQALEMASLIQVRTQSTELYDLGRRITISQEDEIVFMRRWLSSRGEDAPTSEMHHEIGSQLDMLMPGMLNSDEMEALSKITGQPFDRLFLEGMIKHHQGALTMVATLFNTSGAGEEPDIFQFAYHVDSDQYIEIERMAAMLKARR